MSNVEGDKMIKNVIVYLMLTLVAVSMFATVASALDVPITIQKVWLNDREVANNEVRGDILRGDQLHVEAKLLALADADNVQVSAEISGFEHDSRSPIRDKTDPFEVKFGQTYLKALTLQLSNKLDQDKYTVRIEVSDRRNNKVVWNTVIDVNTKRHDVEIKDVLFNPSLTLKAGRSLLASVRVGNEGERNEDNVKVTFSIPELGVSDSDYLDQIKSDDEKMSEELYLRLPDCAKAGDYKGVASIDYNDAYDTIKKEFTVKVLENENCKKTGEKTLITASPETLNIVAGGNEAVYPVSLTNAGTDSRTYVLEASVGDWATTRVTPNVLVVGPGETKTAYAYLAAKKDAPVGEKVGTLTVKSGDQTLQQVSLKANVVAAKKPATSNRWEKLEIGLVVLALLVVIVAVIFAITRMKGNGEEKKEEETYY